MNCKIALSSFFEYQNNYLCILKGGPLLVMDFLFLYPAYFTCNVLRRELNKIGFIYYVYLIIKIMYHT